MSNIYNSYTENYVQYLMEELSDEETLKIANRLGVDYPYDTWEEGKRWIIEDCVYGMSVECFCIEAFEEDMSRERGTPIVASIIGELIIYHSEDNSIREYTTLRDWCKGMLKR